VTYIYIYRFVDARVVDLEMYHDETCGEDEREKERGVGREESRSGGGGRGGGGASECVKLRRVLPLPSPKHVLSIYILY
jgi:hypothetical protein